MKLPKSNRFRFALYTLHLLCVIGIWGVYRGADLNGLAAYMAVTVIPLVAYILGETYRPSTNIKKQDNENT
jgi:hypothetical protein